jgi:hypothetical protein
MLRFCPILTQSVHQDTDFGRIWRDLGPSFGPAATFSTGWSVFDTDVAEHRGKPVSTEVVVRSGLPEKV